MTGKPARIAMTACARGLATFAVAAVFVAAAGRAEVLPQTSHGTAYVTGGVGSEEQQEMRAERERYALRLVFAVEGNFDYLADVAVTIKDRQGRTRLDALATGPFLYANLPPGTYAVTAVRSGGRAITRSVTVPPGGGADEWLFWPPEPASR